MELEVSIPATRPMIGVQFIKEMVQITSHFAIGEKEGGLAD
jgi:hypothetical protein